MELIKATIEDKPLLKNLYSYYLHDLSAYSESLKPNEEGAFEFDSFDMLWETEGINPYLLHVEDEFIGFLMVLESPFTEKVDFVINDFFIYNGFRGKGLAEEAVGILFQEKQGSYYISQLMKNSRAVRFWKKIYEQYQIVYEETVECQDNEEVVYQTFSTINMVVPGR
jgi:predicted acetyltransferase